MLKVAKFNLFPSLALFLVANFSVISGAYANDFVIRDIKVEGIHRVGLGTVLSYLPVKDGDHCSNSQTVGIIKTLYSTGFFSDVAVDIVGNGTLLIKVTERPVVASINIVGSNKITKKQLLEVLKQIGLSEGLVFNHAVLSGVEQALVQQYYNLGCYNVKVQTQVASQPRGRVVLTVNINEGPVAKIKEIRIIGNHAFDGSVLLKEFTLTSPKWWKFWAFLSDDDKYAKDKLEGDLEKLRSFYMDRGYLQFRIDSVQVSLTPDKRNIYIVVHVNEGAIYRISGCNVDLRSVALSSKLNDMRKLATLKPGDAFSRKRMMDICAGFEKFVGDYGYAVPSINFVPEIDEKRHLVFIKFVIDPGKIVYVRRIIFSGNTKTDETVLRREMRQQEGALYSLSKIEESKRKISNLGYLENVDFKTEPVANSNDQVDLQGKVKEMPSASANFQFGYGSAEGVVYGASVNEQNFLGTGKEASIQFNNSKLYRTYGLGYYNPYYTANNVSLRLNAYFQTKQPQNLSLSAYSTDMYGMAVTYGVPLSDYNRLSLGYGYEFIRIKSDPITRSTELQNFLNSYGDTFSEIRLISGWSHSRLDRAVFPTKGFAQSLGLEVYFPAKSGSLSFYKASYNATCYYPLIKSFILNLRGDLGYGKGFGSTKELPFFKNYYSGGMDTVRGFDFYSLGPRDSRGNPLGGNVLTNASVGLVFPNPMGESARTIAFIDVGNVYYSSFKFNDLRSSVGVQIEWRSPLGILRFSLAKPVRSFDGDRKRFFDFAIGTSF